MSFKTITSYKSTFGGKIVEGKLNVCSIQVPNQQIQNSTIKTDDIQYVPGLESNPTPFSVWNNIPTN